MSKKKEFKKPTYLIDKVPNHFEIATTYGYTPIEAPVLQKIKGKNHSDDTQKAVSFLKFYLENEMYKKNQPLYFVHELPFKKSGKRKHAKNKELVLHSQGSLQSISDATAIKTAVAILEQEGYKNLIVDINSVGDKESFAKLEKDLVAYYRKHINSLPANLRQTFKKNVWAILNTVDEKAGEFLSNAPKPMSSLSDVSRKHFKEVLEFLEILDIQYSLNPSLVGEKGLNVHTIFEIKTDDKKPIVLARGFRYNHISKELGMRRDTPGLFVELSYPKKKKVTTVDLSKKKKPQFFFVQLGFEAKLRSLSLIDMLSKKKVSIGHTLPTDTITEQMNKAERMGASHILIMGQREALEKNIVIRDMQNRSQKTISLDSLVDYLKKL